MTVGRHTVHAPKCAPRKGDRARDTPTHTHTYTLSTKHQVRSMNLQTAHGTIPEDCCVPSRLRTRRVLLQPWSYRCSSFRMRLGLSSVRGSVFHTSLGLAATSVFSAIAFASCKLAGESIVWLGTWPQLLDAGRRGVSVHPTCPFGNASLDTRKHERDVCSMYPRRVLPLAQTCSMVRAQRRQSNGFTNRAEMGPKWPSCWSSLPRPCEVPRSLAPCRGL